MSSITAILDPDPDGTVHLPVPSHWLGSKIKVVASLEAVDPEGQADTPIILRPGCLKGIQMAADFDEPLEDFQAYME